MTIPMIIWLMLLAVFLSLMSQIINKLVINEKRVDKSREEIKGIQKDLKTLDPKSKEFKEKQDNLIEKNWWIMKQQFRPMMFTLLPYLVVFYFLSSVFAFNPIAIGAMVDVQMTGTGDIVSECLNLDTTVSGKFEDSVQVMSENCTATISGNEVVLDMIGATKPQKYEAGELKILITPPEKEYIPLPFKMPLVGKSVGWLGTFILTSIASSLILTKALKGRYLRKWE